MKNLILMILLTGLISNAFAQNAVKIKEGEIAPISGVILTEDKVIELDKAQRKSLVLSDLTIHQKDIIEYHKDDAKLQRRKLSEAKFDSWLSNVGYFLLGSILTGVAFTVADKVRSL